VPTTNFDRKKVLGEIFWPFGGHFWPSSGDKNRDNSSSKKSNRDRRQKADSFTKKCPYAFCFFSKIVDNILWGGASFEIREFFFVDFIKLLTYTALFILLLQEEKKFRGKF
jgi:hypothetical protein